jgi:hypothetical protein
MAARQDAWEVESVRGLVAAATRMVQKGLTPHIDLLRGWSSTDSGRATIS